MAGYDFDDLLDTLGLGTWNIIYYIGFGFSNFMLPGFMFAGAFIAPTLNFTCNTEDLNHSILNQDDCTYTIWDNSSTEEGFEIDRKCSKWMFQDEMFPNTLTSEFNLVCDDAYLRPTYQTFLMFGNIFGAPINGFLSDKFGRKRMLLFTTTVSVSSVFLLTFSQNFTVMLIFRFITGATCAAIFQTGYILCLEVCQAKQRSVIGVILSIPWAVGTIWWGLLGYFIKDWRWLMRAVLGPAIFIFPCLWIIDESPRWLIVSGYHAKALQALHRASRLNHSQLPPDGELLKHMEEIEKFSKHECASEERNERTSCMSKFGRIFERIIILYKTPELRKRIFLMYTVFFIASTVYCGLTLNAVNFNLDPFMYTIVGGLSEIPAYILPTPLIKRFGRVMPTSISYFICGFTVIALTFIPSGEKWLIITLAMVGRFCISVSYVLIFLLSSELIPTEVRLQGLGTSSFLSSLGGIIAPFINELLGARHQWLPSTIFGVLSLFAGVAGIFIPETLNKHLPETVQLLELEAKRKKNRHKQEEVESLECQVTPEKE